MEAKQILDRTWQTLHAAAERWQLLRFGRWWLRELESAVPPDVRAWYLQRRRLTTAEFVGSALVLRSQSLEGWTERARIELAQVAATEQPALVRAEMARLFTPEQLPPRLALVLSPNLCLRKTLRLPQAVEENLHAALAFEMDRYTPFRPEQVYFDCAVIARDYESRQMDVALAVAPRQVVDSARQRLQGAGAEVAAVWPSADDAHGLNLLPLGERPSRRLTIKWQTASAVGVVALLCLFAVALPIWQKREQVIALHPVVARGYDEALAADALRRKLDTMVADYNYLIKKKQTNPTALQILEEVTRLLPDDTWVQQFELKTDSKSPNKPREVQLQGETGSSGKMIGLIESSKYLQQASWKSPLTTGQPGSGERYHLAAQVKAVPSGQHGAAPVATASAPAVPAAPAPAPTAASDKSAAPSGGKP